MHQECQNAIVKKLSQYLHRLNRSTLAFWLWVAADVVASRCHHWRQGSTEEAFILADARFEDPMPEFKSSKLSVLTNFWQNYICVARAIAVVARYRYDAVL